MPWPNSTPTDLRRQLDVVLLQRSVGARDVWDEVRNWLIRNGVEAPAHLSEDVSPSRRKGDRPTTL
jgi:hypothetical protein